MLKIAVTERPALTVLSCFSGGGGLDLGLEAAGFETVGLLETDCQARATLTANRPKWPLLTPADVVEAGRKLKPKHLGLRARELDLLAGGPPCQPFSKAGQWAATARTGMRDPRGQAVMGMLDLLEAFRPKAMLIENVAGFLAGAVSAEVAISSRLAQINARFGTRYSLSWHVVDAVDYGVPQHRSRVLATAFRDGTLLDRPPAATHAEDHRTAWDALSRVEVNNPPTAAGKWAELLPCIPEGSNYLHLTARGEGPELFGWRTRYWSFLLKLARDRPSWTLPASPGPGTGPFHWENRPLASIERLALQGFPAEWRLTGHERDRVRLAGNATPPPLAEAAGRQVAAILGKPRPAVSDGLILAVPKAEKPADGPVRPSRLPDRYAAMVGSKPPHPGSGAGPGRVKEGRVAAAPLNVDLVDVRTGGAVDLVREWAG